MRWLHPRPSKFQPLIGLLLLLLLRCAFQATQNPKLNKLQAEAYIERHDLVRNSVIRVQVAVPAYLHAEAYIERHDLVRNSVIRVQVAVPVCNETLAQE